MDILFYLFWSDTALSLEQWFEWLELNFNYITAHPSRPPTGPWPRVQIPAFLSPDQMALVPMQGLSYPRYQTTQPLWLILPMPEHTWKGSLRLLSLPLNQFSAPTQSHWEPVFLCHQRTESRKFRKQQSSSLAIQAAAPVWLANLNAMVANINGNINDIQADIGNINNNIICRRRIFKSKAWRTWNINLKTHLAFKQLSQSYWGIIKSNCNSEHLYLVF